MSDAHGADGARCINSYTRRIQCTSYLPVALALFMQPAFAALNLNTATKDELVALPGIGPAKAQAIIDYRAQQGGFKTIEEMKDVKGIGAKRFDKLKGEITVCGRRSPRRRWQSGPASPTPRPSAWRAGRSGRGNR